MDPELMIDSAINAIKEKDISALKNIARSIPEGKLSEVLSGPNKIGQTPLNEAIRGMNTNIIKYLLGHCHVDPMVKDKMGNYPLCNAIYTDFRITKILIEFRADINTFDNCSTSPLYLVCQLNDVKAARYLIQRGGDINKSRCLISAIQWSNVALIKYLLECEADVNLKDDLGDTPLHACSQRGNMEICRLLIERGALACKNNVGLNPLQLAALNGQENIFAFYSKNGVHTRDEILDGIELFGVRSCLNHDLHSAVKSWNKVLEERPQSKKSSFLKPYQRKLQRINNFDDILDDIEMATIHSMIILERILGFKKWIIENPFITLLRQISITNIKFWESMHDYDLTSSDCPILHLYNNIFAEKFKHYVRNFNFTNINSSILNIAIKFIYVPSNAERSTSGRDDIFEVYYSALEIFRILYIEEMTRVILIVCIHAVKDNVVDFDIKRFHNMIYKFLNSRHHSSKYIFHNLMKNVAFNDFPDGKIYETLETLCRLAGDKVNTLDSEKMTPLHVALKYYEHRNFVGILLKYGALTDTRDVNRESIRQLAVLNGRQDVCVGSASLQSMVNAKLTQNSIEYRQDISSILTHFIEFH